MARVALNIDTIRIGQHDLDIKINHAREFLKEGNKVQFTLRFKGREMAHLNLGRDGTATTGSLAPEYYQRKLGEARPIE